MYSYVPEVCMVQFYDVSPVQGCSQLHSPRLSRVPLSHFPTNFNQSFLFFLKLFSFSPHFGPPGLTHLGRPWLRHAPMPSSLLCVAYVLCNVCKYDKYISAFILT